MNPRHVGCLLIIGALVGLAVKLWSDFGPKGDPSGRVSEPPKPTRTPKANASGPAGANPDPEQDAPGQLQSETTGADAEEDVDAADAPQAHWVVYLSDRACAQEEIDQAPKGIQAELEEAEYLPPAPTDLEATRGLAKADLGKMRVSTVGVMVYGPAVRPTPAAIFEAQDLAGAVAQACHGYVLDGDLGLVFSPEVWNREIIGSWLGDGPSALPRVANHFSTHVQQTAEGQVMSTSGLYRFGVPEIQLVAGPKDREAAGRVLDLAAQFAVERSGLGTDPLLEVEGIDHHEAREQYERQASPDAQLNARVKVSPVEDADEPTVRLELDAEQLRSVDKSLFGSPGARAAAVKALAAKSKGKLAGEILPRFKRGLNSGEQLYVLAPEGWIRVDRWTGARFSGADASDPLGRRAPLEVEPKRAIDYALLHEDGSWEGNATGIELGGR